MLYLLVKNGAMFTTEFTYKNHSYIWFHYKSGGWDGQLFPMVKRYDYERALRIHDSQFQIKGV